jgi:hypothetical protein
VSAIEAGCLSIAAVPDPPAGGGAFAVDIAASCPWNVASDQPWLVTSARPTRWTGKDSIRYTVAPNASGDTRVGGLTVTGGGNTVRLVVTQVSGAVTPSCSYSATPATQPVPPSGDHFTFALTAGCTWEITIDQPWVSGLSQTTGSGDATITYNVAPNTALTARTAHVEIAGPGGSVDVTIEQAAGSCTYAFAPDAAQSAPLAGGTYQKSVVAGCAWTAASDQPWLTTSSSGAGNGVVNFSVTANTYLPRVGHITVSGAGGSAQLTVTQSGCSYTLSPDSVVAYYYGGSYEFTVTTGVGCTWKPVADDAWIRITGVSTGSGRGLVTIQVDQYSGSEREGTVTVADQKFRVTQNPTSTP